MILEVLILKVFKVLLAGSHSWFIAEYVNRVIFHTFDAFMFLFVFYVLNIEQALPM